MGITARFILFTILFLAASGLMAADQTYHQTLTPKTLSDWSNSPDGKISICFAVEKTTFGTKETISVRCAVRNNTKDPITILRPFGDPFYAHSSGLTILGPDGAISYRGAMKAYQLGLQAFMELPAQTVREESLTLPAEIFPGLGKAGLYKIGYRFMSGNYPKEPAPANFWPGHVQASSVSILVK